MMRETSAEFKLGGRLAVGGVEVEFRLLSWEKIDAGVRGLIDSAGL